MAKVPTLAEFAPRYLDGYARANREKPSSIESKESMLRTHLVPRLGDEPLDEVTDEAVQLLKGALHDRSPKTVNNVLTVLNTLLKSAVRWRVIERMPCTIELLRVPPSVPRFYDFDAFARLVEAAGRLDTRSLALVLVLLGGDGGLRRGEIVALEWSHVDFRRNVIVVEHSEWQGHVTSPKGGRFRRVPMTARLAKALTAHRHLRGPRVLYADDGRTLTPKVIRRAMERVERRAGLPVTGGMHVLRHTFCSHLAMRGVPARVVQELAGHTNLQTTLRYMHLAPGVLEDGIRALEGAPSPTAPWRQVGDGDERN